MALVLTCDLANLVVDPDGTARCSAWTMTEYTDASNLVASMDEYLGFDPEIFGIIEGFFIVTFLTALFAGKVARVLMRT